MQYLDIDDCKIPKIYISIKYDEVGLKYNGFFLHHCNLSLLPPDGSKDKPDWTYSPTLHPVNFRVISSPHVSDTPVGRSLALYEWYLKLPLAPRSLSFVFLAFPKVLIKFAALVQITRFLLYVQMFTLTQG